MKTGTIIHGTMRPQDLIPAFLDELRERDPATYAQYLLANIPPAHAMEDDDADWWTSEDARYTLEDLFDALDTCAPEGHYFGAHPGDGSDYGFWKIED